MEKEKKEKKKMAWWLKAIVGIVTIYIIVGIVFAFIIYQSYPNSLPAGKKYPDQQKTTVFMTKIYPYVAVWVNWKPIWVSDFYKQLSFVRQFSAKTQQEMPDNSTLETQVVDQMVDTELLRQQAAKYNIKVSKTEIDDTYKKIADENGGDQKVNEILKELYGMNPADFKALIKDQLLAQKIQEELFIRVHAKHILIKDEAKAKEVLEKVQKNEKSFEDLAKEYSEDTGSRDSGGDLNWFGRGMMVKEFEDAVFKMQQGQVSDLVKTEFGYHIIKLEEKKGQLDEAYLDWFNDMKSKAKIVKWINTNPKESKTANNIVSPSASASSTPSETKAN